MYCCHGTRLSPWNWTGNGPLFILRLYEWTWSSGGTILRGESKELIPVPLCQPQVYRRLIWPRTRASTVRSRWLTANELLKRLIIWAGYWATEAVMTVEVLGTLRTDIVMKRATWAKGALKCRSQPGPRVAFPCLHHRLVFWWLCIVMSSGLIRNRRTCVPRGTVNRSVTSHLHNVAMLLLNTQHTQKVCVLQPELIQLFRCYYCCSDFIFSRETEYKFPLPSVQSLLTKPLKQQPCLDLLLVFSTQNIN